MQYNDHKKEQTMIYIALHRRTCNTMTTRKRTNNDIQVIVLHVLLCSVMYIIVCSFLWSLYCMSFCVVLCRSLFVLFLVVIVLQWYTYHYTEGHAIQWPQERTNNDLHNTTQKDMQYNDHKKEQTMVLCISLFVLFLVVIVLHVLLCSVMYIIVCSFLWSLYCMSFCVVTCNTMTTRKNKQWYT
jgi:uncharacterized membrane protein